MHIECLEYRLQFLLSKLSFDSAYFPVKTKAHIAASTVLFLLIFLLAANVGKIIYFSFQQLMRITYIFAIFVGLLNNSPAHKAEQARHAGPTQSKPVPEYIFGHRCGCEAGVCFKLEVSQWCVR